MVCMCEKDLLYLWATMVFAVILLLQKFNIHIAALSVSFPIYITDAAFCLIWLGGGYTTESDVVQTVGLSEHCDDIVFH